MATDLEYLQRYRHDRSEAAFSALVSRHMDLAYSTAKRVVGSPDLAKEVTQTVFLDLGAAAGRMRPNTDLASWVYVAARRRAIDVVRREARRMKNERAAVAENLQSATMETGSDTWEAIRPYLDEALGRLSDAERSAVIRRFFQNQGFKEIAAELGVSEDAAQKRVSRALERLRQVLARRGVATGAAALTAAVTAHAIESAPSELGTVISADAARSAWKAASRIGVPHSIGRFALPFAAASSLALLTYTTQLRNAQGRALAEVRNQDRAVLAAIRMERARISDAAVAARGSAAAVATQDPLRQEAEILIERIARLHDWMNRVPQDAAPEMALLTDSDWIVEAGNSPALDDYDSNPTAQMNAVRSSLGRLDGVLSQRLKSEIARAAKSYLSQTGQAPSSTSELVPYFDPPVDPSMLTGFTLTRTEDHSKPQLQLRYWRVNSGWDGPLDLEQ